MFEQLSKYHPMLPDIATVAALLTAALLGFWLARAVLVRAAHVVARKTTHTWDDALIEHRVFSRLAQLVPGFIIYTGIDLAAGIESTLEDFILKLTSAYMVLVVTFAITAALNAANSIYEASPLSRERPLKGFVQLLQLVVIIIGLLLALASLVDRSPLILLSGFGAMTAVLLLVFKDTILSFVASIQLAVQDMVRVGDWIEVPQFGADGDVIDVELHTIKIQNWDKTITTVPTHRLISDSFKNWRGMSQSGGRRIKRSLSLDASSIRCLAGEEVEHFRSFLLLKEYVEGKQRDLDSYNRQLSADYSGIADNDANLRRLTNIGTFRAYIYNYLRHREDIHKGMTLLVRQLPSSPQGVPIELYCFTNTTDWGQYEGIQGDIFDHLLAIVGEFGLRLYQQPAGADLAALSTGTGD